MRCRTVLQSGQPYSVIDYSGGVGSVYYSVYDGITNPIVPLAPGCTAKSAKTGTSGAFGTPALKASCFTVPTLAAGSAGGGIPSNDPYETGFTNGQRNIFRQAAQKRADISLIKATKFKERYDLKYTFDVFNLTNTTSRCCRRIIAPPMGTGTTTASTIAPADSVTPNTRSAALARSRCPCTCSSDESLVPRKNRLALLPACSIFRALCHAEMVMVSL
jgi:hypothetical protein